MPNFQCSTTSTIYCEKSRRIALYICALIASLWTLQCIAMHCYDLFCTTNCFVYSIYWSVCFLYFQSGVKSICGGHQLVGSFRQILWQQLVQNTLTAIGATGRSLKLEKMDRCGREMKMDPNFSAQIQNKYEANTKANTKQIWSKYKSKHKTNMKQIYKQIQTKYEANTKANTNKLK